MAGKKETVLYYNPGKEGGGNLSKAARLKGVLVRMGIRIRNISPEQTGQQVGYLAGLEGFEETKDAGGAPVIEEELLLLKNFTDRRLDELLSSMRRCGVEKVELKAVITETNSRWTLEQLYQELKKERRAMSGEEK